MWTLVILAYWWIPQSTDAATSVTVPDFKSKLECVRAGENYIKNAGAKTTLVKANGDSRQIPIYYNYQCVEVK